MKCPKCNYVSHDYLDVCRKCGRDLAAFKQEIGLLVLQPGELDLSLVLGGAGADDLFESVEEEATLHVSDDDDFDISLDDYADHQPGARRFPAATPRAGGRTPEEDAAGLDHLTLELDASSLSAELAAHLRAAQALPDPAPLQPPAPPPAVPGESALPGHVTLDVEPDNLSDELQLGAFQELSALPPAPPTPVPEVPGAPDVARSLELDLSSIDFASTSLPAGPVEQFEMAEDTTDAAMAEEASPGEDTPMAHISDAIPSLHMQDIILAEETPAAFEVSPPEIVEPTIPTIELVDTEATLPQSAGETSAAPPEAALNPSLNSFALSVDDAPFATRDAALPGSDLPQSVEPLFSRVDESHLEEERLSGAFELGPDPAAFVDEETLQDLPMPTLDDADFASMDDALPPLPPGELPDMTAAAAPEGMLTSSDMFALRNLEESTLPEHVTLEMNAPDLPDDLMSSLFEEVEAQLPQDDPSRTGATTGAEAHFTASDAMALGDLDNITLPGHLTIELDAPDLVSDASSTVIAPLEVDNPSGTAQPPTSPPAPRADNEEELVLDLDDLEFDDDKQQ